MLGRILLFVVLGLCGFAAQAQFAVCIPVKDGLTRHRIEVKYMLFRLNPDSGGYEGEAMGRSTDGDIKLALPHRPAEGEYKLYVWVEVLGDDGEPEASADYERGFVALSVPPEARSGYVTEPVLMARVRRQELEEFTFEATKVAFYHNSDTLVYNADAFVLAEGSMLDALLEQMPSVELRGNGVIYCRGRRVDSLLLNGKDLFNGRGDVMLENLAAYTVKDVAVYDKRGRTGELLGRDAGDTRHVMDVRLRREYSHGFLVNAEAGYGTADRYLGRLFGLWFSDNVSLSAYGNFNNLSDNYRPGRDDRIWDVGKMGRGRFAKALGGVAYNAAGRDDRWEVNGNVEVDGKSTDDVTRRTRENILAPQPNTYEYSRQQSLTKELSMSSSHKFFTKLGERAVMTVKPRVRYSVSDFRNRQVQAAMRGPLEEWSQELLEGLYAGESALLDSVINRMMSSRRLESEGVAATLDWSADVKVGGAHRLSFGAKADYDGTRSNRTDRQMLNYGSDPVPAEVSHRRYKQHPHYRQSYSGSVAFGPYVGRYSIELPLSYEFSYSDTRRTSDASNHDDPTAPVPDVALSYGSAERDVRHTVRFSPHNAMAIPLRLPGRYLDLRADAGAHLGVRRFRYEHSGDVSLFRRTEILPFLMLSAKVGAHMPDMWGYDVVAGLTADRIRMVDMVNLPTGNPLVVVEGNSGLRNPLRYYLRFNAETKSSRQIIHRVKIDGEYVSNAISKVYSYDVGSGVSTYHAANGLFRLNAGGSYELYLPFGPGRRFNVSSVTSASFSRSLEQYGGINRYQAEERLKVSWSRGGQRVSVIADAKCGHYHYASAAYDDFTAWTCRYGAEGVFALPKGWGMSTDVTLYTRRGFSDSRLNTTDLVWNARLTKSALKGALVFALDGYDLLRQLSAVTYTVTAQARTEVVSNVIPSYALLHVQWRFNRNPRRR